MQKPCLVDTKLRANFSYQSVWVCATSSLSPYLSETFFEDLDKYSNSCHPRQSLLESTYSSYRLQPVSIPSVSICVGGGRHFLTSFPLPRKRSACLSHLRHNSKVGEELLPLIKCWTPVDTSPWRNKESCNSLYLSLRLIVR